LNFIGLPFEVDDIHVDGEQIEIGSPIPRGFSNLTISLKNT